jgi:hypothetical protein
MTKEAQKGEEKNPIRIEGIDSDCLTIELGYYCSSSKSLNA